MTELWTTYAAKLDALSERERISVFVALTLVCIYLVYAMTIEPAQRRASTLHNQIVQQKSELQALQAGAGRQTNKEADPDAVNRARGEELKRNIDELNDRLTSLQRDLVPADRMGALLQEMLDRDPGLQLVGMRTLPSGPLIAKSEQSQPSSGGSSSEASNAVRPSSVYKHGVEITVRGTYTNLHAYLTRLEKSPWRMFWWRAKLTASDDARSTMVVTIYTLSLDKAWLKV